MIHERGRAPSRRGGNLESAIFAGGCFWCLEWSFKRVRGVWDAIFGYTGGEVDNPTYEH
ncbi:MAG: peptide-methionine (S)-S-oxide reductase [Promethearchaeota archaeon]